MLMKIKGVIENEGEAEAPARAAAPKLGVKSAGVGEIQNTGMPPISNAGMRMPVLAL
jgi:hypothetical protein